MAKHKHIEHKHKHIEHKRKVNNSLLGIVAIFAIFLIVYFAMTFTPRISPGTSNQVADQSGYVAQSAVQESVGAALCKLVVGMTTIYDSTTLAVTLEEGASTAYAGRTVSVTSINSDGCVVKIDYVDDYLAVGQIQKVGTLYVTVTDVTS
jgi:hypothetical protein